MDPDTTQRSLYDEQYKTSPLLQATFDHGDRQEEQNGPEIQEKARSFQQKELNALFEQGLVWRAAESARAKDPFCPSQSNRESSTFLGKQSSIFLGEQSSTLSEQSSTSPREQSSTCRFGIEEIDGVLPLKGLPFGAFHEFVTPSYKDSLLSFSPIFLISYLLSTSFSERASLKKYIFWVGEPCWASPFILRQCFPEKIYQSLFEYSVFLKPHTTKQTLSALDIILRSEACYAVIAHLPSLSLAQSKRFAILLKKNAALGFFLLPKSKFQKLSAAHSRWSVHPTALSCPTPTLAWELELLKVKGAQPNKRLWTIGSGLLSRKTYETFSLYLSSELVSRSFISQETPHERRA